MRKTKTIGIKIPDREKKIPEFLDSWVGVETPKNTTNGLKKIKSSSTKEIKTTVRIPEDLYMKIRTYCFKEKTTMKEMILEFFADKFSK